MSIDILDTIDIQKLGQKLQQTRIKRGMVLEDAAQIIAVAYITLMAIENGERRIQADELIKLAHAYGCQIGNFVGHQPEPEPFQINPTRNHYLAVAAFDQGLITEGQFAQFLTVDRIEARHIAETLRQHIRNVTDNTNFEFDIQQLFGSEEAL